MKQYLSLLQDIVDNGFDHEDRTGVGRRSVFSRELRFDISNGQFPLVTTRQIFTKAMIAETLWFLTGKTSVADLTEQGVKIWDQWVPSKEDADLFIAKYGNGTHPRSDVVINTLNEMYPNYNSVPTEELIHSRVGTVGPMYGTMWRNFEGHDQIARLVKGLKEQPFHSRHVVNAWNDKYLPISGFTPKENVLMGKAALAACHCMFQCFVSPAKDTGKLRLSLKVHIRSADTPIGTPYNIAQYALLQMMIAQCVDMEVYELIVSLGDAHIYRDQLEGVMEQLKRTPYELPMMRINPEITDIDSFKASDFHLVNYIYHEKIIYPVAM